MALENLSKALEVRLIGLTFSNAKRGKTKLALYSVEHNSHYQHLIFGKSCQLVVY